MRRPPSARCTERPRLVRGLLLPAVAVALLLSGSPAGAHFATIAYSTIVVDDDVVAYDLYFDPYHLRSLLPLDHDLDGYVRPEEVDAAQADLAAFAEDAVRVTRGGAEASADIGEVRLVAAGDVRLPDASRPSEDFPLIHVPATFTAPVGAGDYRVEYLLLDHPEIEEHENIVVATTARTEYLHVFDPDAPVLVVADAAVAAGTIPPALTAIAVGVLAGTVVVLISRARSRSDHRSITRPERSRRGDSTGGS